MVLHGRGDSAKRSRTRAKCCQHCAATASLTPGSQLWSGPQSRLATRRPEKPWNQYDSRVGGRAKSNGAHTWRGSGAT